MVVNTIVHDYSKRARQFTSDLQRVASCGIFTTQPKFEISEMPRQQGDPFCRPGKRKKRRLLEKLQVDGKESEKGSYYQQEEQWPNGRDTGKRQGRDRFQCKEIVERIC